MKIITYEFELPKSEIEINLLNFNAEKSKFNLKNQMVFNNPLAMK